jgi:hypothetical protein
VSSRTVIVAEIHRTLASHRRKDDGGIFRIVWLGDRDRLETRFWKVFVNDIELIEKFEKVRVGGRPQSRDRSRSEPADLSCWAMINAAEKRRPTSKTKIRAEERIVSYEANTAPMDTGEPNDAIGF